MTLVDQHASVVGVAGACRTLGVSRATWYRRKAKDGTTTPAAKARRHPRRLSDDERRHVLDVLCSEEFIDRSPRGVYAILLERGEYLCSVRTMYRILREHRAVRERRSVRNHPENAVPRCCATSPNQLWSWDITKIPGPPRTFYSLYVVLDVFSRYVVAWLLARRESACLATRLIEQAIIDAAIEPNQLTVHADRGAPMTSRSMTQMLADLHVERSHSRPRVSNDNPFSEAQFKTMKYGPTWPTRFTGFQDAYRWAGSFMHWYNHEHRHEGIGFFTPADVHFGRHLQLAEARQRTLVAAYAAHPERFVKGPPSSPAVPTEVWINHPGHGVLPLQSTSQHQGPRALSGVPGEPEGLAKAPQQRQSPSFSVR